MHRDAANQGISALELVLAVAIIAVVSASAVPGMVNAVRSYRAAGDARAIASQLSLARMRSASEFTQARLKVNQTAGTYQVELCTTKGSSSCATFTIEGAVQRLSSGNSFGFGTMSTPAGTCQTSIAQPTGSVVVFNSRGIPVDSSGGALGTNVIYLNNGAGQYYAVSVCASSQIAVWQSSGSGWVKI